VTLLLLLGFVLPLIVGVLAGARYSVEGCVLVFGGLLVTYAAVALMVGGLSSVTELTWLQDAAGSLGLITLLGLPVIAGEFTAGVMVGRRRRVEGKG
jgi:hypothetical protein